MNLFTGKAIENILNLGLTIEALQSKFFEHYKDTHTLDSKKTVLGIGIPFKLISKLSNKQLNVEEIAEEEIQELKQSIESIKAKISSLEGFVSDETCKGLLSVLKTEIETVQSGTVF